MAQHFFGYGSLVNRTTHDYPGAHRATAQGWTRTWVATSARSFAFLSVIRSPGTEIDGLIAEVPGGDWVALDRREAAYDRIVDTEGIRHGKAGVTDISIYAVPGTDPGKRRAARAILRSYLDVVLQGFLNEFGEDGARRFLATTQGWEIPIEDDRPAPIYPRHRTLSRAETDLIDRLLAEADIPIG